MVNTENRIAENNLACLTTRREGLFNIVDSLRASLGADMGMISFLTSEYHHVVVASGFDVPPETEGRFPLDYSICVHVIAMDFPLVIDDAISHPLLKHNRTVDEYGVAAYLGAPIHLPDQGSIGTVCFLQMKPRRWSMAEIGDVIAAGARIDRMLMDRKDLGR